MQQSNCVLPGGFIDASGQVHKHVKLRSLTGLEEEILQSQKAAVNAARVSVLISQCVESIGTITPVTEDIARQCLAADRQYLMLKLRQATFGDKVEFSVSCPWTDCSQQVDVSFSISSLDIADAKLHQHEHEWLIHPGSGSEQTRIRFRLPNGADQEALVDLAFRDEPQALNELLWRCIQGIGAKENPDRALVQALPATVKQALEEHMQILAPDLDISMLASCPECGREFNLPFDIQDYFLRELNISEDSLRREVHYLAFHYHWGEQEILRMSRDKRRQYIHTLAEEIERMNESVARHVAA